MHGTQPLHTPRLCLRRFVPGDAPAMYAGWASDAAVARFMRWQPHNSVAETRGLLEEWAAQYAHGSFYNWAVVRQADGALMGAIGAGPAEDGAGLLEPELCPGPQLLGARLCHRGAGRCGALFVRKRGQAALACCHAHENPASGCVMRKCGFRYTHDGIYYKYDGTAVPCRHYLLTKEEFQTQL